MYIPAHFAEQRPAALHALMRDHPLATLVLPATAEAGASAAEPAVGMQADLQAAGLDAHHIPLLLDTAATADAPLGCLRGHVARANTAWRQAPAGEVLAVFLGPQAYVTPSWYASKAQHGKVVPTWNYIAVHAYGVLRWVDDAPWLRALLNQLTDTHESPRPQPWQMDDAPEEYLQQMMSAVVGLELRITRLIGKWKVSQNRPPADIDGVVQGLRASDSIGHDSLADALLERRGTR
jgi:transcriptional regulator